jgi:hypothetical protein
MHRHEEPTAQREQKRHPAAPSSQPRVSAGHDAVLHLQRTAGNAGVNAALAHDDDEISPVKDVVGSGGGKPLDSETRSLMEARMGQSFGDVRIHTDGRASESAKGVDAAAYTVGTDVVFQSGRYQPNTPTGQRMLAHELTHVVQQKAGPVAGTPAPGGINLSDPSDRFEQEAERNADAVMKVQRVEEDEEESQE